ncbi:hypothetical protein C8R45DRAFT_1028406 [Mycena sanguinolenta]|nr:hypothetical protein C8R45DRAFT_1028406 [Mycena sanguinolenta]
MGYKRPKTRWHVCHSKSHLSCGFFGACRRWTDIAIAVDLDMLEIRPSRSSISASLDWEAILFGASSSDKWAFSAARELRYSVSHPARRLTPSRTSREICGCGWTLDAEDHLESSSKFFDDDGSFVYHSHSLHASLTDTTPMLVLHRDCIDATATISNLGR